MRAVIYTSLSKFKKEKKRETERDNKDQILFESTPNHV
jgi:hypothetical protein